MVVRIRAVTQMTGLSRSTIYAYMAAAEFPKQIKIGRRAVGWRLEQIEEWLASKS